MVVVGGELSDVWRGGTSCFRHSTTFIWLGAKYERKIFRVVAVGGEHCQIDIVGDRTSVPIRGHLILGPLDSQET